MGYSDQITQAVTGWPGVEASMGDRGEWGFSVNGTQIGHLHGDRVAHFGFPKDVWHALYDEGRIDYHPVFPGRPGFEGFTLRLFEPKTGLWRIWWASSVGSGLLDEPVVGRFEEDGIGRFECDDILEGVHFRVRYDWHVIDTDTLRWEQSFSFDGRRNWESNWVMDSTRIASPVGGAVAVLAPA